MERMVILPVLRPLLISVVAAGIAGSAINDPTLNEMKQREILAAANDLNAKLRELNGEAQTLQAQSEQLRSLQGQLSQIIDEPGTNAFQVQMSRFLLNAYPDNPGRQELINQEMAAINTASNKLDEPFLKK